MKTAVKARPKTKAKPVLKRKTGVWQLQDAKASFSEVVKASQEEPQIITVHGKEAAVLLSYDEFIKLTAPEQSLFDLFQNSPFKDVELEMPSRTPDNDREVEL